MTPEIGPLEDPAQRLSNGITGPLRCRSCAGGSSLAGGAGRAVL